MDWSDPRLLKAGLAARGLLSAISDWCRQNGTDTMPRELLYPLAPDKRSRYRLLDSLRTHCGLKADRKTVVLPAEFCSVSDSERTQSGLRADFGSTHSNDHVAPAPVSTSELKKESTKENKQQRTLLPSGTPSGGESAVADVVVLSRQLLEDWNQRKGQRLSWGTWGPKIKAKVQEHGADAVREVFDWYFACKHQRARKLHEGDYGLKTLMWKTNFEEYLGFARQGRPGKTGTDPLLAHLAFIKNIDDPVRREIVLRNRTSKILRDRKPGWVKHLIFLWGPPETWQQYPWGAEALKSVSIWKGEAA